MKKNQEYFGFYETRSQALAGKFRAGNKYPDAKRTVVKKVAYSVLIEHLPPKKRRLKLLPASYFKREK